VTGPNPPRGDVYLPLVYDELRRLAAHYLRSERSDHTLQPTALVHEAFLRLRKLNRIPIQDRRHFVALAARVMRNVLVEHARAHKAAKRGGMLRRVTLAEGTLVHDDRASEDVLALEAALQKLEREDPRLARLVELRFFGGLTAQETAEVLDLSEETVLRDWRLAKSWLLRELTSHAV